MKRDSDFLHYLAIGIFGGFAGSVLGMLTVVMMARFLG